MSDRPLRAACIGAGLVGRSWAYAFAAAGGEVRIHDQDVNARQSAWDFVASRLDAPQRARVQLSDSIAEAVRDVDYVQESIVENLDAKRAALTAIDEGAEARTLIASSTSSFPGSAFMSHVKNPGRCLVAHPLNPPHLLPIVEICPTPLTEAAVVARAAAVLARIGHSPIVVHREIVGLVCNRIQAAVFGEAMHLVDEGYCTAQDIDIAMTQGLGLRWAALGPLAAAHLNSPGGFGEYMAKYGEAMSRIILDLKPAHRVGAQTHARIEAQIRAAHGDDQRRLTEQRDLKLARVREALLAEKATP